MPFLFNISLALLIVIRVCLVQSQGVHLLFKESIWVISQSKHNEEDALKTYETNTISSCVILCGERNDCQSIAYKTDDAGTQLNCVLHSSTSQHDNAASWKTGWITISKTIAYPRVQLPTKTYGITTQGFTNIALGKPTSQSTTYADGYSCKAVDGNSNNDFYAGFCASTYWGPDPWWKIDLLHSYMIYGVAILKHTCRVSNCADDMREVEVRVGPQNSLYNEMCAFRKEPFPDGKRALIMCKDGPRSGQFVTLHRKGPQQFLSICEIEILGFRF